MTITPLSSIMIGVMMSMLVGCNTPSSTGTAPNYYPSSAPIASTPSRSGYGIVQAIETVPQANTQGVGVGTIAGAVIGGVLGNQVGKGSGNTAATIAGVAGGALAGHELEKRNQSTNQTYRITVQMNDGSLQTVVQETPPLVRIGERVWIANGVIQGA